jgi:pyruvate ferredoxin oxidoreductase beta subunit
MNTGIQKSSLTPFGARTTTTPAGANAHGCLTEKKRLFEIVAAHGIPYAATASIGYVNDFIRKVDHAKHIHGTRFIHVIAPCPTGWGCAEDATISVAREVVDCGLWYLAEYEDGRFRINKKPKEFSSVAHYMRGQGRFRALTDGEIERVEAGRDETWRRLAKLESLS